MSARPSSGELRGEARALIVAAVRDEFAREGLEYVDLPEHWTRQHLVEAAISDSEEYRAFSRLTVDGLGLDSPEVLSLEDMSALMRDDASADAFGPTLESAGAAATFLVAHSILVEASTSGGVRDEARDVLECELEGLKDVARRQLTKMVTVPQELRSSVERNDTLGSEWGGKNSSSGGTNATGSDSSTSRPDPASDGISMADVMKGAAKVQAFLNTEQGRQVAAAGAAAFAMGQSYLRQRSAKSSGASSSARGTSRTDRA